MKQPRVAFFTDSLHEVNGVALTSREFVKFAQREGRPFLVFCAGQTATAHVEGSLETMELATSPLILRLQRDLSFDFLFHRHRARVRKKLLEFRPDLVHITGPSHLGMLGAILAYELKVPLVASWHTNVHEFACHRLSRRLRWLSPKQRARVTGWAQRESLRWTLRFYQLAKLLFAPNPELVQMLEERTGRPTFLMQRGIDTHLFSPSRRKRSDSAFVIGYTGRLAPEKNVRLFADIERDLCRAGIRDCRFLIVGEGSERPWLTQNLRDAGLPGVLSGEALAEAYASMDAFVFPSETDTFGNVVLEAMASGTPVIVSKEGGPKFLVRSGKNGYVAAREENFVEALMDLRSHTNLREQMRQGARETALGFSWDRVFNAIYARYGELLTGAKQVVPERSDSMPLPMAL